MDSLGSQTAIDEFAKKLLTHPNTGAMLSLEDPKAIDALKRAQKRFEYEDGLQKLDVTVVSTEFESAEWVDSTTKKGLIVYKAIIFSDRLDQSYTVSFPYDVEEVLEEGSYKVKRTQPIDETVAKDRVYRLGGTDSAIYYENEETGKQEWKEL